MKRVLFTALARRDIESIWDFTAATWDADQADYYTDSIEECCMRVAAGTVAGKPTTNPPGYRKAFAGSHLVFYRETEDIVTIVRILHQRQDVEHHLSDSP
ncbi:type II toxin-antitoxin system RelE/ParE family toxin [Gordonia sp. PP30]|uniref:type II toxin-antitoxin system RelE/ParE family toxin n=1 Tax=unclassified Gordonia (in: high G+C Gram-positive bacteria) TaxID=2657482 RepID=UPI001FFE6920|nr:MULTISPECIES: type II toxin-antitoxin system RelE/ParE family toxin [unclassified Gordonia (in: high G+C Gram-positive bacteria)]UQE74004.1 type II toxin-antitoxin system RelE/ParE family toxin [Gordonia sp. PP30]